MPNTWKYFAHRSDGINPKDTIHPQFMHIYNSKIAVSACGKGEIVPVIATEVDIDFQECRKTKGHLGYYYGYLNDRDKSPSMIFAYMVQFQVCFPYGIDAELECNRGRIVVMAIEEEKENADV